MPTSQELLRSISPSKKTTERTGKIASAGREANEFLALPWYKQIFTENFVREIPGAVRETVYGTPAKFGASVAEIPETIKFGKPQVAGGRLGIAITGEATQKTHKLPGLKPFKSFQSEAETAVGQIIEGERPLWHAALPFLEVPLAGLETFALGKGALGAIKKTPDLFGAIKGIAGAKSKKKALSNVWEVISPPRYKSDKIKALRRTGKPGGAVKQRGKITVTPTKREVEMIGDSASIVNKRQGALKNIRNIDSEISRISEDVVRPFLESNPGKIKESAFTRTLSKIDKHPLVLTEKSLENTYDRVIDAALDTVKETRPKTGGHTNLSMYNGRIKFDQKIKKQFTDNIFDEDKLRAVKVAVWDVRDEWNKFIAQGTPNSGKVFTGSLRKMSNLFRSMENIAEKNYRLIDTSAWHRFVMNNPGLMKSLKLGAGAVAGAIGVKRVFGD